MGDGADSSFESEFGGDNELRSGSVKGKNKSVASSSLSYQKFNSLLSISWPVRRLLAHELGREWRLFISSPPPLLLPTMILMMSLIIIIISQANFSLVRPRLVAYPFRRLQFEGKTVRRAFKTIGN